MVFLAFPLFLRVHAHLQLYYYRDPADDQYHLVDPIPEKRPAEQHEKQYCQLTYIPCMN